MFFCTPDNSGKSTIKKAVLHRQNSFSMECIIVKTMVIELLFPYAVIIHIR
jgi:hypothetical protein